MYHFVKDIKFMEQLKELGFTNTFAVTLVGDRPFYQGSFNEGIYKYFREEHMVYGRINKPTGSTKESITLNGSYKIDWHDAGPVRKYYIVAI
jgi:phosphoglycerol transferase MdoB-like AlkP superfamily enzyme